MNFELQFNRSSFCGSSTCVEVAIGPNEVWVRQSAEPSVLRFSEEEWAVFVAGVKAGEFDM